MMAHRKKLTRTLLDFVVENELLEDKDDWLVVLMKEFESSNRTVFATRRPLL